MSPRGLLLAAACTTVVAVPAAALAGPPKAQRLVGIKVLAGQRVQATLVTEGVVSRTYLAQVLISKRLRLGRRCVRAAGDVRVVDTALELGLDVAARTAPERRVSQNAVYVFRTEGANSTPARSLNYLLVKRGLARVSNSAGSLRRAFLAAQRDARRHQRGIWGCQAR